MAVIYFETTGILKVGKGFTQGEDLSNIKFHIAFKPATTIKQVFLIMEDSQGMRDIIELHKIGRDPNKPYLIYAPSLDQPVRLESGTVSIQIMILDVGTKDYQLSNVITTNLTTSHYRLTRQIYLAEALGAQVKDYYEKIVKIFEQFSVEKGE